MREAGEGERSYRVKLQFENSRESKNDIERASHKVVNYIQRYLTGSRRTYVSLVSKGLEHAPLH